MALTSTAGLIALRRSATTSTFNRLFSASDGKKRIERDRLPKDRTRQVAHLHDIKVNDNDVSDAKQHEILQHLISQGTTPNHHHMGGRDSLLLETLHHTVYSRFIIKFTSTMSFPIGTTIASAFLYPSLTRRISITYQADPAWFGIRQILQHTRGHTHFRIVEEDSCPHDVTMDIQQAITSLRGS